MILYKYKSVDYIEDVIINKRLFCSKFDELNDPMEWAFTSDEDKNSIKNMINETDKGSWRICCLSKSEQYGLMWSMYGQDHTGVCIEVEIDIKESESEIEEYNDSKNTWYYCNVQYLSDAKHFMVEDCKNIRNDIMKILWSKSRQWEHEQEVRFVRQKDVNENNVYLPVKINAIYLGLRIDPDKACYIKKLCKYSNIECIDSFSINYWKNHKNKCFRKK